MRPLSSCHQISQTVEIGGFLDHLSSTYEDVQFIVEKRREVFPSLILTYKPDGPHSHNFAGNHPSLTSLFFVTIHPSNEQAVLNMLMHRIHAVYVS